MNTLGKLKADGFTITLYCSGQCTHSWVPSWDQLIQYFGVDYDLVERKGWGKLVCEVCGHRAPTVSIVPGLRTHGWGGAGQAHAHGALDAKTAARLHAEGLAAQQAIWRQVDGHIATRKAKAAERKHQRDKARQLIGPPNPFVGRGR